MEIGFSINRTKLHQEPSPSLYSETEECCPSTAKWVNISKAYTVDGFEVEVLQNMFGPRNQYFWVVKCAPQYEDQPCRFIDKDKYITSCVTETIPVPAITYDKKTEMVGWQMIEVAAKCTCIRHKPAFKKTTWKDRFRIITNSFYNRF